MSQIISPQGINDTISEAAEMCGDPFFRDFGKDVYELAWLRAVRSIAIDYDIFERQLTIKISADDIGKEIEITPLNYFAETRFLVNGVTYSKVNEEVSSGKKDYYIRYNINQWVFDYSDKALGDTVVIFYKSSVNASEDFEIGNLIPVIPDHLYEELLKRIIKRIASQGLVNFSNEKADKYSKALKIYTSGNETDPKLHTNSQWVKIKPYQPL
ncbi:MAG: hypothetical protein Q8940_07160 [Bacteroidota bacterium]|nr:hypothetical protein [Bacteroidota bacterium]